MDDYSVEYPGDITILAGTQSLNGKEVDVFDDSTRQLNEVVSGGQLLTKRASFKKIKGKLDVKSRSLRLKPLYKADEKVAYVNDVSIREKEPRMTKIYGEEGRYHELLVSSIIVNNNRDLNLLVGRKVYPFFRTLILDNLFKPTTSYVATSTVGTPNPGYSNSIPTQLGIVSGKGLNYNSLCLGASLFSKYIPEGGYYNLWIGNTMVTIKDFAFCKNVENGEQVVKWKELSQVYFPIYQQTFVLSELPLTGIKPMTITAVSPKIQDIVANTANRLVLVVDDFCCLSVSGEYKNNRDRIGFSGHTRLTLTLSDDE